LAEALYPIVTPETGDRVHSVTVSGTEVFFDENHAALHTATLDITGIGGKKVKILSGHLSGSGSTAFEPYGTYRGAGGAAAAQAQGRVIFYDPTGAVITTSALPTLSPFTVDNVATIRLEVIIPCAAEYDRILTAFRATAGIIWKILG